MALTDPAQLPEFVSGLVAPDLHTEVALALDAAAKALESAFQRMALTLG